MAQIRRPPRHRSPPPRQIPLLSNPIRFQPSIQNNDRSIPVKQYDPVSGIMIDRNNSEQSLMSMISSSNQLTTLENNRSIQNNNITEESVILPTDDEKLFDKKHLPIYAQFPFNFSFLPEPMETNIEDNIHKLRIRLINSELNHQRRSTNDYIKRTHRIGMENDHQNNLDIERELERRRIYESFNKRRRSNQQLMPSDYSYDPRLHSGPLNEQIYISANVDDLIDSMARRHLTNRRLDPTVDRQRRSNGYNGQHMEQFGTSRGSFRTQQRTDDLLYPNRSPKNHIEHDIVRTNPNGSNQILRSRIDYYNRIQPDYDGTAIDDPIHTNSYTKLPPISPGYDFNHLKNPSSSLNHYETKHDSHIHRNHHQTLPGNLSDQPEHLIELPSDIFLSTRPEVMNSSQKYQQIPRSISKDKTDRSDGETEVSIVNRQRNLHKKNLQNDHDGFFTDSNVQQKKKIKYRRNLFKKISIGILFIITLKNRAIKKNRSHRLNPSPSATIHKIRLQEIIVALHRVYLEPDGPIYNGLIQAIINPISLKDGLNSSSKNYLEAIKIIGNSLKNIISKITDFMPKDGVLGTSNKSAVAALIQDGNPFPENYFWQCERELLEFDNLKVINITKQRAILLFIGMFIFRALVTTLLIKPIKYRLILGELTSNQSANLKVLASVILYIGRRVARPKFQILTLPHEWQLSLYNDRNMETIIQHSEIKTIISTCEQSLRMWCEEYIRRIDGSFGKELRK